jgi:hypothetical protein
MDPTFFTFLSIVSTGIKTGTTLRNFVRNELGELLQQIGDAESEEAIDLLTYGSSSKDERIYIHQAANSLSNAAMAKYLIAARSNTTKASAALEPALSWWYGSIFNIPRFLAYRKACVALILSAVCYKYLDESQPMQEKLKDFQDVFDEYQERVRSAIKLLNKTPYVGVPALGVGAFALGFATGLVGLSAGYLGYRFLDKRRPGRWVADLPESGDPLRQLHEQVTMFNGILVQLRQGPALPISPSG